MTKPINEYTIEELSKKIEAVKSEREKTANALKKYEEELERRKQEVPLGVPIEIKEPTKVIIVGAGGEVRFLIADPKDKFDEPLCYMFNTFHSWESAEKHAEMLLTWRKALVANAKGEPIDIQVLLPLLPKGWVAMNKCKNEWVWHEKKPTCYSGVGLEYWESDGWRVGFLPFNIKPAENWKTSLQECGL